MKAGRIRGLVAFALVVGLTVLSLAFGTGTGTLSALGIGSVAMLCPVGALESFLGARQVTLHGALCVGVTVLATLAAGKAFCAWACPVPWLRRFFFSGKKRERDISAHGASACAGQSEPEAEPACMKPVAIGETSGKTNDKGVSERSAPLLPVGGERDGGRIDGRHVVLAGALASSFAFGFPVFCLVCPVGLVFATLIALWRLVGFNETTWGLLLFPTILLIEVLVLRKWCTRLCPISALLSLISRGNRTLRPRVGKGCLRAQGKDCRTCVTVCPEQLDPHTRNIPECSKCAACVDACPAKAISIRLLSRASDAAAERAQRSNEPADKR